MKFDFSVFAATLFALLVLHFLADFPLQGEYLSKSKDPRARVREIWIPCMLGHCLIHAGAVYFITGSLFFAMIELAIHFWIDYAKCMGKLGAEASAFLRDQMYHWGLKLVFAFLYAWA